MQLAVVAAVALALAPAAHADVYLHNPRGSNDRNCERNQNRNNGNRLFDSQNNDKGGYACPRAVAGNNPNEQTPTVYYYAGSQLVVDWTTDADCFEAECTFVVQYMCEDENPGLRDGIPNDINDAATDRMATENVDDPRYGYHETVDYYEACDVRTRNLGLWTGNGVLDTFDVNGTLVKYGDATRTRQNPNGNRRGWECPEERDYYPYWHPTPWTDVAVITTETSRCSDYQSMSENVVGRGVCRSEPAGPATEYNNQADCTAAGDVWVTADSKGAPAPECVGFEPNEPNLNQHMTYVWTLPERACTAAVLRVRQNVTTLPWESDAVSDIAEPNISTQLDADLPLWLARDDQLAGRVYQDRTYVFEIELRPEQHAGKTIHNLGVMGKRGNQVHTFPAISYSFAPAMLEVQRGDLVHIQWTGSDYNPNRGPNNAEGGPVDPIASNNARADRSNIVETASLYDIVPVAPASRLFSEAASIRLGYIDQNLNECDDYETLLIRNNGNDADAMLDSNNCMNLSAAKTPYFDGGLFEITAEGGDYHFMCTRNTNFSNRLQKGTITVADGNTGDDDDNAGGDDDDDDDGNTGDDDDNAVGAASGIAPLSALIAGLFLVAM